MLARELDRRNHVGGLCCGDCIDTWLGCPGADPAQCLGEPRLVAEKEGIFQFLEELCAVGPGLADAGRKRRAHRNKGAVGVLAKPGPFRIGRPSGILRADAPGGLGFRRGRAPQAAQNRGRRQRLQESSARHSGRHQPVPLQFGANIPEPGRILRRFRVGPKELPGRAPVLSALPRGPRIGIGRAIR